MSALVPDVSHLIPTQRTGAENADAAIAFLAHRDPDGQTRAARLRRCAGCARELQPCRGCASVAGLAALAAEYTPAPEGRNR